MDYGQIAEKELKDDAGYERGLFIKEILVLAFMASLVYLRECVWQECYVSEDAHYQGQFTKGTSLDNPNGHPYFFSALQKTHKIAHNLIVTFIKELKETSLTPYKEAAFLFFVTSPEAINKMAESSKDSGVRPKSEDAMLSLDNPYFALVKAIEAREKKDFPRAEALINIYMNHYPRDLEGYFEAAIIQEWQENFKEALAFYRIILTKKPKHINALLGKARVIRWEGGCEEARHLYYKVLTLRPNTPDALSGLGMCELNEGNNEAAFKYFKRVINIFPAHAEALIGIQMAGFLVDGTPIPLYEDDTISAINPDDVPDFLSPYLKEAEEARDKKDFVAAEYAIQQFLVLYPENILGLFEYAVISEWQGKLEDAAGFYDRILFQDAEHIGALLGTARILRWQGHNKAARKQYQFVLSLEPNNLDALTGLGMCALLDKNRSLAFSYFEQVLAENPHHEEALQGTQMTKDLIIGQLSAYMQWQTNDLSGGSQSLTGFLFSHQLNTQWRIGGHFASTESSFMVAEGPAETGGDSLKRLYEAHASFKPSNSHFWLMSVQQDEHALSTTRSFQVNTGLEIFEDHMFEVSARWFQGDEGLKNTLYSASFTHPFERTSWRITGQVFFNKSALENVADNHSLVGQALWEPDDDHLFRASISSSYYLKDHHYGISSSWKQFWNREWGYEIGVGYHDNNNQIDVKSSIIFRY